MAFNLNSLTLMGKVGRDQQFGRDPDFRSFYNNENNNNNNNIHTRADSGLSGGSNESGKSDAGEKVVVDLDLIVEKWISHMWERTRTKNIKYELDDLQIVVNWKRVEIEQNEAKFENNMSPKAKIPSNQTLFRTHFTNRTDQEQEYSFKTERVTRQAVGFSFVKGFSREKEGAISFKLPSDIVEIGGGIKSEQSVECGKDQTNEQEVTWGVDSIIKVKPHSKTTASLVISEIELNRNFYVETKLKGRLTVSLNNRENNQFVKSFSGDIVDIIKKAMENYWLPAASSHVFELFEANGEKFARSILRGKCKFRLGVEQHVTLTEENI